MERQSQKPERLQQMREAAKKEIEATFPKLDALAEELGFTREESLEVLGLTSEQLTLLKRIVKLDGENPPHYYQGANRENGVTGKAVMRPHGNGDIAACFYSTDPHGNGWNSTFFLSDIRRNLEAALGK